MSIIPAKFISTVILSTSAFLLCSNAASIKDFGAIGDGRSDDTQAFRQAIEAAGSEGEPLQIPPGTYLIRGDITVDFPLQLLGSGAETSIITSGGQPARILIRHSGTTISDVAFEDMIEPIALVSRSGYMMENIVIERCRFERIRVNNGNRGVIGLSSGSSTQRPHRLREIAIRDCLFRHIDANVIVIRANISEAHIANNRILDVTNTRSEGESPVGAYAIRLGESSDDGGTLEIFAPQGRHLIEGNTIRDVRKHTVAGGLMGILVFGNYSIIRNNIIENIDGTMAGDDVDAIYIRGAFNEIRNNVVRDIRGADDDGAVCFKGGLDLGSQGNIVANNIIENIYGMSAIEASTSGLLIIDNEIRNAPIRGVRHRSGDGITLRDNLFENADTDLRGQGGEVHIHGNEYLNSRIYISERRGFPVDREAVFIHGNSFAFFPHLAPVIRFSNDPAENFVSIRDNRFDCIGLSSGSMRIVDLVSSGTLERVEVVDNFVISRDLNGETEAQLFRLASSEITLAGNTIGTAASPAPAPVEPQLPSDLTLRQALVLSWTGLAEQLYQLQTSEDLQNWADHGEPIAGQGDTIKLTDLPGSEGSQLFYRVLIKKEP